MNIEDIINEVIRKEDGFQNDPNDRGNWTSGKVGVGELKGTKWGISAMSYPHLNIQDLTREEAYNILYCDYVVKPKFNLIPYPDLQAQLVDFGVNSGPSRAIEFLQKILRVEVTKEIDGATLSKLWSHDPLLVNDALAAARAKFIDEITDASVKLKKFEEGLESRALSFVMSVREVAND